MPHTLGVADSKHMTQWSTRYDDGWRAGCENGAKFGNTPPVAAVPRLLFDGNQQACPLKGFKFGVYKEVRPSLNPFQAPD